MALWGGRFEEGLDKKAYLFNESLSRDKRLYKEDIEASIAHAEMLKKQNIILTKEADNIIKGLKEILDDIESKKIEIENAEDIHSYIEAELIKRISDDGKRLHTARSRNDQVAVDMKLYMRKRLDDSIELMDNLINIFLEQQEKNKNVIMPGFTHLQKAQPITLGLYFGAFVEMFKRDKSRLIDTRKRLNECPLGSGALAGTDYNIDRKYVSDKLLFDKPTNNTLDSVSDRDYLAEYLFDLSLIMTHLSRLAEEMIIFNTNDYKYITISDKFSTGSSIMPQKKNPDIFELIRGKTASSYGSVQAILSLLKALPLAYDKDLQEDKRISFEVIDDVNCCIEMAGLNIKNITWNEERLIEACKGGFIDATDFSDYLTKKGVPFRDAHKMVGELVLLCEKQNKTLSELSLDEINKICDNKVEKDIYDKISLLSCVKSRNLIK